MKNKSVLLVLILVLTFFAFGCSSNTGIETENPDTPSGTEATAFPEDAIKILCHQSAGGSVDTTTRILAEYAQNKLGVPIIVENVLGASGRVAHTQVFNAASDGYTLGTENIPTLPIGELSFEGQFKTKDYAHIYGYIDTGHIIVVNENSPIKTMEDLVEKIKSGRTTVGTFGKGSSSHLQMITIAKALGMEDNLAYVHFEGTSPQLTALLGDNTDFAITGYGAYSKTPGLRPLAVAADERDSFLSDVPTLAESGVEADIITQLWGFMAPPETPDEVVKVLANVFAEAVVDPGVIEKFAKINLAPVAMDAETFKQKINEQYDLVVENLSLLQE